MAKKPKIKLINNGLIWKHIATINVDVFAKQDN